MKIINIEEEKNHHMGQSIQEWIKQKQTIFLRKQTISLHIF